MKYMVQCFDKDKWETVNSVRAGLQSFDDLGTAFACFRAETDTTQCFYPMRIIDSDDKTYATYDPELDARLPGPRYRLTQKLAYQLWEQAGKPYGDGMDFWLQAEKQLPETNGVTHVLADDR